MKTYQFKNREDYLRQVEKSKRRMNVRNAISWIVFISILVGISLLSIKVWEIILK